MKKNTLLSVAPLFFSFSLVAYPPNGTLHDIAVDFQGTFSMIDGVERNFCSPTFITQADVGTAGLTINSSGIYKLGEDINFMPGGSGSAITISADNVLLDLQCFGISQGNSVAGVNGIAVSSNRSQVTIKNGSIQNFTTAGILAGDSDDDITIDGVNLIANDRGILFEGTIGSPVSNSFISNVDFRSSPTGIDFEYVENTIVKSILGLNSLSAAFDIKNSFTNVFDSIQVRGVAASDRSTYGIKFAAGGLNQLSNSSINEVSTRSTDTLHKAAGISLDVLETADQINNVAISGVRSLSFNSTSNLQTPAYGIELEKEVSSFTEDTALQFTHGADLNGVRWSPDGRYCALGGATGTGSFEVRVLELLDGEFKLVASAATAGSDTVTDVAWSPDGRYLAVSLDDVAVINLEVFDFSGVGLTLVATTTVPASFGDRPRSVDWSPGGTFIVVGNGQSDTVGGSGLLSAYTFDGTNLVLMASTTTPSNRPINVVRWSPNGRFIAIGTESRSGAGGDVRIYELSASSTSGSNVLTLLATSPSLLQTRNDLAWSNDNRFIISVGNLGSGRRIMAYEYNGSNTLADLGFIINPGVNTLAVDWEEGNQYFSVATDTPDIRLYKFNGTSIDQIDSASITPTTPSAVSWKRDGTLIAVVGDSATPNVQNFTGFQTSSNHQITSNKISTVSGPVIADANDQVSSSGHGMSVMTDDNLVLGNSVYKADTDYNYVETEQYNGSVHNVRLRNEFPNKFSNTSFLPL